MSYVRKEIKVGDRVRVRRGHVGEGYTFKVARIGEGFTGGLCLPVPVAYAADGYGPRPLDELERVLVLVADKTASA